MFLQNGQLRKMVKNHNICLACRKYLYSHSNSCEFCFQGMCWILETLIQSGWEISASSMTNVTTGYDAGSYFLKKNSAPALHNAQVAAVVIGKKLRNMPLFDRRLMLGRLRAMKTCYSKGIATLVVNLKKLNLWRFLRLETGIESLKAISKT